MPAKKISKLLSIVLTFSIVALLMQNCSKPGFNLSSLKQTSNIGALDRQLENLSPEKFCELLAIKEIETLISLPEAGLIKNIYPYPETAPFKSIKCSFEDINNYDLYQASLSFVFDNSSQSKDYIQQAMQLRNIDNFSGVDVNITGMQSISNIGDLAVYYQSTATNSGLTLTQTVVEFAKDRYVYSVHFVLKSTNDILQLKNKTIEFAKYFDRQLSK